MDLLEKSKRVLGGITKLLTQSLRYLLLLKHICYTRGGGGGGGGKKKH